MASLTPVTVTVWATFQFAAVNVRLAGETVPSAALLLESAIVTSAVGCAFITTVKLALPPASVVVSPATGVTEIPATSSSVLLSETSAASRPE